MPKLLANLHTTLTAQGWLRRIPPLPALVLTGGHRPTPANRDLLDYLTTERGWHYLRPPLTLTFLHPRLTRAHDSARRVIATNRDLDIEPCEITPQHITRLQHATTHDIPTTAAQWWQQATQPDSISAVILAGDLNIYHHDLTEETFRAAHDSQLLWRTAHLRPGVPPRGTRGSHDAPVRNAIDRNVLLGTAPTAGE